MSLKIEVWKEVYYFDVGVYRSLPTVGFLDSTSEIDGPGLEGLVLQHLRAWNDYQGMPYKLYYWRTQHLYAIEVKHAKNVY